VTLVRRHSYNDDLLGPIHIQNVVLEHAKDSLSNVPRKLRATLGILPNVANRRFHVRDESIAKTTRLFIKVRDLFLEFNIRFFEKPVRLHSFLVRARRKTSSPSIARLPPA
jgi:hypothetical protein